MSIVCFLKNLQVYSALSRLTAILPLKRPSHKETNLPTVDFQGQLMLVSGKVSPPLPPGDFSEESGDVDQTPPSFFHIRNTWRQRVLSIGLNWRLITGIYGWRFHDSNPPFLAFLWSDLHLGTRPWKNPQPLQRKPSHVVFLRDKLGKMCVERNISIAYFLWKLGKVRWSFFRFHWLKSPNMYKPSYVHVITTTWSSYFGHLICGPKRIQHL